jgi:hypothetical protein
MNTWTPGDVIEYLNDNGIVPSIVNKKSTKWVCVPTEEQRIYFNVFARLLEHDLVFIIKDGVLYIGLKLGLEPSTYGWGTTEGWNEK